MKKVTIEITPEGYSKTIEINGKKHVHTYTAIDRSTGRISGSFEDNNEIPEDLCEAVDLCMELYDIMDVLRKIEE